MAPRFSSLIVAALVLADVSAAGARQAAQTLPHATIADHVVTLHPSGATFRVPEAVRSGPQTLQFTTYLSRPELERVRGPWPAVDEWDGPFSSILNAALPFESCAAHVGTAPFGPDGRRFSDLQIRAYVVEGAAQPIIERVAKAGLERARVAERFGDAAVTTEVVSRSWTTTVLAYTMNRADYRAPARIDFYTREFGRETAILVFMYSPNSRWPWTNAIIDIVSSFTWPPPKLEERRRAVRQSTAPYGER